MSLYYMQLVRLLLEALDGRYSMLSPSSTRSSSSSSRGGEAAAESIRIRAHAELSAVEDGVLRALEAVCLLYTAGTKISNFRY